MGWSWVFLGATSKDSLGPPPLLSGATELGGGRRLHRDAKDHLHFSALQILLFYFFLREGEILSLHICPEMYLPKGCKNSRFMNSGGFSGKIFFILPINIASFSEPAWSFCFAAFDMEQRSELGTHQLGCTAIEHVQHLAQYLCDGGDNPPSCVLEPPSVFPLVLKVGGVKTSDGIQIN